MISSRHLAFTALLLGGLTLSACGSWSGSRLKPGNWFDRDSTEVEPAADFNPLIPVEEDRARIRIGRSSDDEETEDRSVPITRIAALRVDRTPTGAIVLATGEAFRLGAYEAALVPVESSSEAELAYTFRVTYPTAPSYRGTEATRTIRAAVSLSEADLRNIRSIRVIGEENAREVRR